MQQCWGESSLFAKVSQLPTTLTYSLLAEIALVLGLNLGYFTFSDSPYAFPEQSLAPILWASTQPTGLHIGQHQLDHDQFGDELATFIGISDNFPIYQRRGFELGGRGGVYTQFTQPEGIMEDRILLNSDYQIGIYSAYQLTPRWLTRLSLDHQSSHLGDEYSYSQNRNSDDGQQEVNYSDYSEDRLQLLIGRSFDQGFIYSSYAQSLIGQNYANENFEDNIFETQRIFRLGGQYRAPPGSSTDKQLLLAAELGAHSAIEDEPYSISVKLGLLKSQAGNPRFAGLLALEYYQGPSTFSEFVTASSSYYGLSYSLVR